MPDTDALRVRSYREGDEAELVSLFGKVFGRQIDTQHWRWKLGHATPATPNVWLATSEERPVFQYAGIPVKFAMNGAPAHAMVSVDTMTSPDFRKRGLLTRVAGEAYARWRDAGVEFVFGLPNQQWGSRAAALGWVPLFDLQRLVRPLRPEALLAQRLGLPWLSRLTWTSALWNRLLAGLPRRDPTVQTRLVARAGEEFDRLWDLCRGNARFSVIRDRAWVTWRFVDCPSRRYHVLLATRDGAPVGYCAYSIEESNGRRRALLAELTTVRDDAGARRTLLADLLDALLAQGAEYVLALAPPATPLHRELRALGFFAGPAFSVQMVPLATGLPLEELKRAQNWDLSGAAFDVI